jgi:3-oxoacyl-[acyl-carrier-protein] synthase II
MQKKVPRRVAVTGYGAVCSLGNSSSEIWNSIVNYRIGYQQETFPDSSIVARYFGMMHNKPPRKGFPKAIMKFLPEFARLGMVAADEAVTMAFGRDTPLDDIYDPFERGVIFGTGWGSQDESTVENANYRREGMASPFSNLLVMSNVATAAMSMHWNLRGYQNTPIAACATGSIALGDAFEVIRSGRAKVMLAGGGESIREGFCVWSIDALRALSKEQEAREKACCPFSADRSGFVLSEGAAVLCLEDMESAQARGAKILGEVVGYGNYSDARDITSPAEDLLARTRTIQAACAQAGLPLNRSITSMPTALPHRSMISTRRGPSSWRWAMPPTPSPLPAPSPIPAISSAVPVPSSRFSA